MGDGPRLGAVTLSGCGLLLAVAGCGMMGAVATVVDRIEQAEAALRESMDSRDAAAYAQALEQVIALAGSDPEAGE
jgi:hypothetical protein